MKLLTVQSRSGLAHERLDAGFFVSPGVAARERLTFLSAGGAEIRRLGDVGDVWQPMRFSRAWAASEEPSVPYLRPYDCFEFLPTTNSRLSRDRTAQLDRLLVQPEMLLQTCSGRNLGPVILADAYLGQFALSHDMARIEITDSDLRYYVLVYLSTPTGRAVIRQGMSGSVIDHLSAQRLADVPVAILDDLVSPVASVARKAIALRGRARKGLAEALGAAQAALPMPKRSGASKDGWTVRAQEIDGRIDVAYNDPLLRDVRDQVAGSGGSACGELAEAFLPVRYKRYYVDPPHGRPILSGRNILQYEPINLRRVSDRSFQRPEEYELAAGMVVFGAVGRSEGRQGWPALVTEGRTGWLASNDVMRLSPRKGVNPAALWLATALPQAQMQIKAQSFGSVVDHMNSWDVERVLLPTVDPLLVRKVSKAWKQLQESVDMLTAAANELEHDIRERSGAPTEELDGLGDS